MEEKKFIVTLHSGCQTYVWASDLREAYSKAVAIMEEPVLSVREIERRLV